MPMIARTEKNTLVKRRKTAPSQKPEPKIPEAPGPRAVIDELSVALAAFHETGDYRTLIGWEDEFSHDEDRCDRVFYDKHHAFYTGRALGETAGDEARARPGGDPGEGRERLYSKSAANRRVLFLELVAWAVVQLEDKPAHSFSTFEYALTANRVRHWREMPWSGAAKDPEQFVKHVERIALAFTGDGEYPLRRSAPPE